MPALSNRLISTSRTVLSLTLHLFLHVRDLVLPRKCQQLTNQMTLETKHEHTYTCTHVILVAELIEYPSTCNTEH